MFKQLLNFSTVLETTKQSLEQELLELQKLQDEFPHLTSLLKGKEIELSQLKEKKRQLQWRGNCFNWDNVIHNVISNLNSHRISVLSVDIHT